MAEQDEQILIQQAQRGNLNAFNRLIERYQDRLYTVAYRLMGDRDTASDMAQEALITAYRKLDTYSGGNFQAWLSRIVTNRCYDELRKQKRQRTESLDDSPTGEDGAWVADSAPTPERALQDNELQQAIQNCIQRLSPDHRAVLVMSDVEDMPYQEIADALNANVGTVKSRLSRARLAMRQCLARVEELLPAEFRLFNKPSAE